MVHGGGSEDYVRHDQCEKSSSRAAFGLPASSGEQPSRVASPRYSSCWSGRDSLGHTQLRGTPQREHAGVCFLVWIICSAMYATETGGFPLFFCYRRGAPAARSDSGTNCRHWIRMNASPAERAEWNPGVDKGQCQVLQRPAHVEAAIAVSERLAIVSRLFSMLVYSRFPR